MTISGRLTSSRADALALLRSLISGLGASARAVERHTGLTNAQLFLLQELASGPLSNGALAARAQTQASTVSLVLSRLVRAGLVTRGRASDDRRRAVVALTATGRRLIRRAPVPPTARLFGVLEELSAREARALIAGLRPLLDRLEFPIEESAMLFESRTARRPR